MARGSIGLVAERLRGPAEGLVRDLLRLLDVTANQSTDERAAQQELALGRMLAHARARVPFYAGRLDGALRPGGRLDPDGFARLPVLSRALLQEHGEALYDPAPSPAFAPGPPTTSSGSTGRPVTTRGYRSGQALMKALQLRAQRWHGFDFGARFAFITAPLAPGSCPPEGLPGAPWATPLGAGASLRFDLMADTPAQLAFLERSGARYLATYPSNLQALLRESQNSGRAPERLAAVMLSSEPISSELIALTRAAWGAAVLSTYSASELGALGFGVPPHEATPGGLHVQSESVLVELLGDDGAPAPPGEVGRVVVTTLQDYLRPLVRYELGDYAEALAAPSEEGVRLPRLGRVLGRERAMIRLPDGRRVWPYFEFAALLERRALRQWQLVQRRDLTLAVRVVADIPLGPAERRDLEQLIERALPGLPVELTEVPAILRTPRGKYPELVSELCD